MLLILSLGALAGALVDLAGALVGLDGALVGLAGALADLVGLAGALADLVGLAGALADLVGLAGLRGVLGRVETDRRRLASGFFLMTWLLCLALFNPVKFLDSVL